MQMSHSPRQNIAVIKQVLVNCKNQNNSLFCNPDSFQLKFINNKASRKSPNISKLNNTLLKTQEAKKKSQRKLKAH